MMMRLSIPCMLCPLRLWSSCQRYYLAEVWFNFPRNRCSGMVDLRRIVRGETRNIKTQAFVQAAQLNGLPPPIITKHILRTLISPVIVFATLTIPSVILLESVISFLGLGVQAPSIKEV